jgi:hypothetical protein
MNNTDKPVLPPDSRMLELKEFLYSSTEARAGRVKEPDRITRLRELLWIHRFDVLTWLMQQGVAIPVQLVADATHARPGAQSVDKRIDPEPEPSIVPGESF